MNILGFMMCAGLTVSTFRCCVSVSAVSSVPDAEKSAERVTRAGFGKMGGGLRCTSKEKKRKQFGPSSRLDISGILLCLDEMMDSFCSQREEAKNTLG